MEHVTEVEITIKLTTSHRNEYEDSVTLAPHETDADFLKRVAVVLEMLRHRHG